MEKPHDEKENFFNSNPFPNYLLSAPNLQLPSLNMTKKAKSKTKSQKSHTSNLRAGDWVCLICNNLNFSFRNECNRCQVQTKEQNQLQSLYISDNPNAQDLLQNRLPFKDLTNDKAQPVANKVTTSNNTVSTSHIKSKSTPIQGDLGHIVLQNLLNNEDIHGKFQSHLIQGTSSNKGFENKLLVTPPKHRQNKSLNIFKEYSDSSQKELPPYRSPEHLPSISPIMKNVFGYNYREVGRDGKSRSAFTFLKEDGQPISEIDELESKESSFTDDWRRVDKIRANLASMDHSRVNSGSGTIGSENGWRSTVENSMEGDFFENIKEIRQDKKE